MERYTRRQFLEYLTVAGICLLSDWAPLNLALQQDYYRNSRLLRDRIVYTADQIIDPLVTGVGDSNMWGSEHTLEELGERPPSFLSNVPTYVEARWQQKWDQVYNFGNPGWPIKEIKKQVGRRTMRPYINNAQLFINGGGNDLLKGFSSHEQMEDIKQALAEPKKIKSAKTIISSLDKIKDSLRGFDRNFYELLETANQHQPQRMLVMLIPEVQKVQEIRSGRIDDQPSEGFSMASLPPEIRMLFRFYLERVTFNLNQQMVRAAEVHQREHLETPISVLDTSRLRVYPFVGDWHYNSEAQKELARDRFVARMEYRPAA